MFTASLSFNHHSEEAIRGRQGDTPGPAPSRYGRKGEEVSIRPGLNTLIGVPAQFDTLRHQSHLQAFQPFKTDLAQVCLHFHDRLLLLWRRWELTRPSGPGSDSSHTPAPEGTWRWSGTKTTGAFRCGGQTQACNTHLDHRCDSPCVGAWRAHRSPAPSGPAAQLWWLGFWY